MEASNHLPVDPQSVPASQAAGEIGLSIVIVNSDGAADTLNCLETIYVQPPSCVFEVVLVDNCSADDCLAQVERQFPAVRCFNAPQRQGFARNYNLGLRHCRGDYLLILNNDTLVGPDALDALREALQCNPGYGMVGPQLVGQDGKIQTVCARPLVTPLRFCLVQLALDQGLPTGRLLDSLQRWRLAHRPSGPVACLSGAAMMLSRAALDRIGLLDEGFDFYFEDVEWCHRAARLGYRPAYIREARIIHLGDQSLSKVKVWAKQSEYRSALRYFRAYYRLNPVGEWLVWQVTRLSYRLRRLAFTILPDQSLDPDATSASHLARRQTYGELIHWIDSRKPGDRLAH